MGTQPNNENSKTLLLSKAREEFASKGYAEASTTEIVELAKVTRGALYYHFKDKKHLFSAVYKAVSEELYTCIKSHINNEDNSWQKLTAAFEAFFDECANAAIYRIIFEDSVTVLSLEERMTMDSVFSLFNTLIQACKDDGVISPPSAQALAHHLHGAVQETAYLMIHQPDNPEYKAEALETFMYMLNSLKK